MVSWKVAFIAGSSKQTNADLASEGSKSVIAIYSVDSLSIWFKTKEKFYLTFVRAPIKSSKRVMQIIINYK